MSLSKISILFFIISFSLLLTGSIRIIKIYDALREGLIEKKNFFHAVKVSGIDAMDDFSEERYEGEEQYFLDNLEASLIQADDGFIPYDRDEILASLSHLFKGEGLKVFTEGRGLKREGMRFTSFAGSKIKERFYFYAGGKHYHRNKSCPFLKIGSKKVFSSMEEAAKQGFYPCEVCIMNRR